MIHFKERIALAPLTTFEIGGPARFFCEVKTEDDLREALLWARERNLPYVILAGGSNVLMPDEGLEALVIRIALNKWSVSNGVVEAEAGCDLLSLIRDAATLGLGGWEKLAGIPGTIGGAVRGNAGAFGPEIKDFVTWVRALDANTHEMHEFSNAECEFSYRTSHFKKHAELVIVKVHLRLEKMDGRESMTLARATIAEREKRHIQNVRAAGSYFMNPVAPTHIREMFETEKGTLSRGGRVPAGWLIEKAGMKGAREGGAEASVQHPNYLVNNRYATARDVRALAKRIKDCVKERFGIELMEEAAIL